MNYSKIYTDFIEDSFRKPQSGYTEIHHILPRCLGGTDEEQNLIKLSGRRHYIAHLLLAKIYGGKLWYAANLMKSFKNNKNLNFINRKITELLKKDNKMKILPRIEKSFTCLNCKKIFKKILIKSHLRERIFCSRSCSASYNGTLASKARKGLPLKNGGHPAWNKGIPNPLSSNNGKKGAKKMSKIAKGRKKFYISKNKWTWVYP